MDMEWNDENRRVGWDCSVRLRRDAVLIGDKRQLWMYVLFIIMIQVKNMMQCRIYIKTAPSYISFRITMQS